MHFFNIDDGEDNNALFVVVVIVSIMHLFTFLYKFPPLNNFIVSYLHSMIWCGINLSSL